MMMLFFLAALFHSTAAPPQDAAPAEVLAPLTMTPPNARERGRCLRAGELSRETMTVTMRCRITRFGRPAGCQPLDPPRLQREEQMVFDCMARAHRFEATDGASPERESYDIRMTASNQVRI